MHPCAHPTSQAEHQFVSDMHMELRMTLSLVGLVNNAAPAHDVTLDPAHRMTSLHVLFMRHLFLSLNVPAA